MENPPYGDKNTKNNKRKILGEDGLTKGQRRRQGRKKRKEEQLQKEEEERMKAKNQEGVEEENKCAAQATPVVVGHEALARKLAKNQRKSERKRKEREEQEEERKKRMKVVEDQCLGLRNNTLTKLNRSFTEEQAKAIGSALSGNSSLQELILHFYHLSVAPDLTLPGVQALCNGILQSELKELWLCGNITDPQSRQCLYQAVAALPSLEVLSVSFYGREALDHDNVISLSQALMNNTSIRELSFHVGCELTEAGAEALALGLQHALLEKLHVKCSDFDDAFYRNPPPSDIPFILFEAIQHKMQSLDVLTISEFGRQVPFTCIANGLQTTTSLQELIFKNEKLDVDAIRVMGTGLSQNNSVKILRLVGTSIDNAGITELASHIHHDSCLQELHFDAEPDQAENEFGPAGLQALLAAVEHMPALRTLNLSCNENLGYRGWKIVGDALPNLTLRELDLQFYPPEVDDDDGDDESTERYDSARQALLEGMRANEHVWKILVHVGAFGRQELFDEMYFYADRNLWGRRLLTVDHGLSPTIWCHILERGQKGNPNESFHDAKNGPSIIYYILREQPNLVQPLRHV